MKIFKKILITALIAVFITSFTAIPAISSPVTAQAATIKLSKKALSLGVGKTATLKISGTKKAVTWTSSDSTIASVSKKGKITAAAIGEATITATVNKKQFTCTVTVTNPYLADAPFKAQEINVENMIDLVIPADWTFKYEMTLAGVQAQITPTDTTKKSSISILIAPLSQTVSYNDMKTLATSKITKDLLTTAYTPVMNGTAFEVTDLSSSDLKSNIGSVLKTQFSLKTSNASLVQQIYDFVLGNYMAEITSANIDGDDLSTVIEYAINSIIVK